MHNHNLKSAEYLHRGIAHQNYFGIPLHPLSEWLSSIDFTANVGEVMECGEPLFTVGGV